MERLCKLCKKKFVGRSDKVFCTIACKTVYNQKLNKVTNLATFKTDKILHRNRSILLEIMGKNEVQKKVKREILDTKKFHFGYITQYHLNSQNKTVHYIYDFSYIIFSDQEVLIKRIRLDKLDEGH